MSRRSELGWKSSRQTPAVAPSATGSSGAGANLALAGSGLIGSRAGRSETCGENSWLPASPLDVFDSTSAPLFLNRPLQTGRLPVTVISGLGLEADLWEGWKNTPWLL